MSKEMFSIQVQVDFSQIETAIQKEEHSKEFSLCQSFQTLNASHSPQPSAIIVHSTFPPPPPQSASVYPQYYLQPPPAFYPPPFCGPPPPMIPPAQPPFLTATLRSEDIVRKVPRDNPGLPIQDDICKNLNLQRGIFFGMHLSCRKPPWIINLVTFIYIYPNILQLITFIL